MKSLEMVRFVLHFKNMRLLCGEGPGRCSSKKDHHMQAKEDQVNDARCSAVLEGQWSGSRCPL